MYLTKGTIGFQTGQSKEGGDKMQCAGCGTELADGALLCPGCGRVVQSGNQAGQSSVGERMSKKDFGELPGIKFYLNEIRSGAVFLYISAGVTFLASTGVFHFMDGFRVTLLDAVLILALGIWLQFGKSRIASILILVVGMTGMILGILQMGVVRGYLIPIVGVMETIATFKYQKLWKQYQKTGEVPDGAVRGFKIF